MLPAKSFRSCAPLVMGAAMLALAGCGHDAKTVNPAASSPMREAGAPAAGPSSPAPAAEEPQAPSAFGILLGSPYVTADATGLQASAPSGGTSYSWGISGGVITSGATEATVTYSAGAADQVLRLFCRMTDAGDRQQTAVAKQLVVPAPVLSEFKAVPEGVSQGGSTTLLWTAKQIKSLTLDPGSQDVSKVGFMVVKPTETTTYTLKAENHAGTAVTKQVVVKVVPPPVISSFRTSGPATAGQPITLTAEFSGGHAEIRSGDAVAASSDSSPLNLQVVAAGDHAYTLTVTNAAGQRVSRTLTLSFTTASR